MSVNCDRCKQEETPENPVKQGVHYRRRSESENCLTPKTATKDLCKACIVVVDADVASAFDIGLPTAKPTPDYSCEACHAARVKHWEPDAVGCDPTTNDVSGLRGGCRCRQYRAGSHLPPLPPEYDPADVRFRPEVFDGDEAFDGFANTSMANPPLNAVLIRPALRHAWDAGAEWQASRQVDPCAGCEPGMEETP